MAERKWEVVALALLVFAFLQSPLGRNVTLMGQGRGRGAATSKPVPHLVGGTINLGNTAEDKGLWIPRDRTDLGRRSTLALVDTIPFQPWAKALWDDRQVLELEPHTRCHPSGAARQFQTPYGVEFVQSSDLQRIFIFDVGGPHTFRTIYMNGQHPTETVPTSYGHSVGRWEGDTLVVDTRGYSENFWIDRTGLPHTDKLHTVERFTRTNFSTIKYEILIDDPSVYTRQWTGGFDLSWSSGAELFEYVCQDNNTAPTLMMDDKGPLRLTSPIVP
jgi:hypothetical protein